MLSPAFGTLSRPAGGGLNSNLAAQQRRPTTNQKR
jgi:hypothetical protein